MLVRFVGHRIRVQCAMWGCAAGVGSEGKELKEEKKGKFQLPVTAGEAGGEGVAGDF